uniref:Variant surface glycoprotein 1125.1002 n=1 Tax=Trypanosoma brucei TaxID=5691 RepID=A0A1J0R621_9TRYP|nr:variant surface glycoprotein 1125.1002 [Trypanosoma brucei]
MASVICVYQFITSLKLRRQQQATKTKTKCKQSTIKIAFHIILMISVVREAHSYTDGDNAGVFGHLCKAMHLADGALTFSPPIKEPSQKASDIYKLNITVAQAAWRHLMVATPEEGKAKPKDNPPQGAPDDWETKWTTWTEAALYLAEGKNEENFKKQFIIDKASIQQLDSLRPTIAQLADTAYELDAFYKAPQTNKPKDDAALTEQLFSAIYGKKPSNMQQPETATIFTGTPASYANSCGTETPPPAAKTLAETFLYICGSANGQTHKPCAAAQTTQAAWQPAAPPQASAWPNLRQICPATEGTVITDGLITNLISAVMGHNCVVTNDLYIGGQASDTTCNGGANACCVKFTNGELNKQIKNDAIDWAKHLEDIADDLRQRSSYNSQVTEYDAAITLLEQQVKAVIKRAHYTSVDQQTASTGAVNSKDGITQLQKVNCNNHKTNATCTEANCKWEENASDKSKGTCKPKDREEQTNTATGDGTAAAKEEGKKCSDKKTEGERKSPACKTEVTLAKIQIFFNKISLMASAFLSLVTFWHSKILGIFPQIYEIY